MSSTVTVPDLVADVRLISGLRSNPLYSDHEIAATFLDDAAKELYDIFVASLQHWFRKTVQFTLTGGEGGNTFDLSTVPDFQMDQGLNYLTNGGRPRTVTRLGSFAERNAYGGVYPFGGCDLQYFTDGDILTVTPPGAAASTYELIYTKQIESLDVPVTRNITVTPVDDPIHVGGQYGFSFANGAFTNADVGQQLVVAFSAPNVAWNGTYTIATVNSPTSVFVEGTLPDPSGFTTPTAGTASVISQPPGTRGDLPQVLCPWASFLKVHAAVVLNTSRQYPCSELQAKLEIERRRATSMAKMRSEGVQQAPITRRRVRFAGWVY